MKNLLGLLSVVALVVACKAKEGEGGGASKAASNAPDEVAKWMSKEANTAWQGAWTMRMNLANKMTMNSPIVAVDIKGDGAKAFDGKAEIPLGIEIESPCSIGFKQPITEGAMKGGTSTHTKQFLIKDGKVLAGEGAVGMRKGKAAVACLIGMDSLTTLDEAGKCKSWSYMLERWSSKDTTCTWSKDGDKDVLSIGSGTWTTKLVADGDLLMSDQFAGEVKKEAVKKQASFDAAKQAVTDAAKK